MKLGIMQPYFFPYIGYFQCIKAVDKYILYENLDYIKEGWMHRNRIKVKYKEPVYISIRLQKKSSNKKIFEIKLDENIKWKQNIIKTIEFNYRGSKFFKDFLPVVEQIIFFENYNLHEYNSNCIKRICNYLDIETEIQSDNSKYLELEKNLRSIESNNYDFHPDFYKTCPSKKTARAIEICKNEKADILVNAIGGMELYDKKEFANYDIKLYFIRTKEFKYEQFTERFVPNLSIIDVIMHCGKERTKDLLNNYELL